MTSDSKSFNTRTLEPTEEPWDVRHGRALLITAGVIGVLAYVGGMVLLFGNWGAL